MSDKIFCKVFPGTTPVARQGMFGGHQVNYLASLETVPVICPAGESTLQAQVVSTSYVATEIDGNNPHEAQRPVVFFFNGGPITPSVFLHMLAFGPQRLRVAEDLAADPAGFAIEANTETLLDVADIVFYDPPGTGFSRVSEGTPENAFFSVDRDADVFVAFVRAWCEEHGRIASPKYLFGESYGTLRAAASSARMVCGEQPLRLNGVYLFGQALNIVETVNRSENIMSYVVSLPTLAALGAYHGKTAHAQRPLAALMEEVFGFARSAYLQALVKGREIGADELQAVAQRLADYTGLDAAEFAARGLRVSKNDYRRLLFGNDNRLLGAQDGRYLGPADVPGDPAGIFYPALIAAHREYLGDLFGLPEAAEYVTTSPVDDLEGWRWGGSTPFSDWPFGKPLAEAMQASRGLRLVLGVGYHDTLTTYGAARYAICQSGWPADRVELKAYEGGHMAYTRQASYLSMTADLRGWISVSRGDSNA